MNLADLSFYFRIFLSICDVGQGRTPIAWIVFHFYAEMLKVCTHRSVLTDEYIMAEAFWWAWYKDGIVLCSHNNFIIISLNNLFVQYPIKQCGFAIFIATGMPNVLTLMWGKLPPYSFQEIGV